MARRSKRAPLVLTDDERERLRRLARSRIAPKREVERAEVLLLYAGGERDPRLVEEEFRLPT